jgi:hypothetical protein
LHLQIIAEVGTYRRFVGGQRLATDLGIHSVCCISTDKQPGDLEPTFQDEMLFNRTVADFNNWVNATRDSGDPVKYHHYFDCEELFEGDIKRVGRLVEGAECVFGRLHRTFAPNERSVCFVSPKSELDFRIVVQNKESGNYVQSFIDLIDFSVNSDKVSHKAFLRKDHRYYKFGMFGVQVTKIEEFNTFDVIPPPIQYHNSTLKIRVQRASSKASLRVSTTKS